MSTGAISRGNLSTVVPQLDRQSVATPVSWGVRRPVLAFVAAPLAMMIGGWFVYLAAVIAGVSWIGGESLARMPQFSTWCAAVIPVAAYLPTVATTMWLCWLARPLAARGWCLLLGCLLVAALSGALQVQVQMPALPGQGKFSVGLGWPPSAMGWCAILVSLGAVATWLVVTRRPRQLS